MVLDGHIHISTIGDEDSARLVREMQAVGIDGGILMSLPPTGFLPNAPDHSPRARLLNVLSWCTDHETLFPFFWLDPLAEDALEQVEMAIDLNICGFKIICDRFFPHNHQAITVFRAIARQNRPILFHSGILWDGKPSSRYNHPVEFEILGEVDDLRFALAHIGWPWCDECIAVYGKIEDARQYLAHSGMEMFVDTTPGTPPIYREEALSRLFQVGYRVEQNVMFGSDSRAGCYSGQWVSSLIQRDREILAKIGIAPAVQDGVFAENLLRFIHGPGTD
jgi:predicted TIM-barrel fold metal-dependent hydrolase